MDGLQPDIRVIQEIPQIYVINKRLGGVALQRRNTDDLPDAAGHQPLQIAHYDDPKLPPHQLFAPQIHALILKQDLPHALAR